MRKPSSLTSFSQIGKLTADGVLIALKVTPKASKTALVGVEGNVLKVRIAAQPEKGKANDEIIDFFSSLLKVPRSRLSIYRGEKSRQKTLLVEMTSLETVQTSIEDYSKKHNFINISGS